LARIICTFAEDASNTLWFSGGQGVLGWIIPKLLDETGDDQKSQGWTAFVSTPMATASAGLIPEPKPAGRSHQGPPS